MINNNDFNIFNNRSTFNILPDVNIGKLIPGFLLLQDVKNLNLLVCTHVRSGSNTISNFIGGTDGQNLRILGDGATTVLFSANIKTNTGADKLLASNMIYRFTYYNLVWIEDA